MSSSYILSDNGVSSGSAGLKSSAGNDGVLVLQTANSSGTATTAVTIDTSQNVGIGVSPYGWTGLGPVLNVKTGTGAGTFIGTSVDNFRMLSNTYYDGAYKRIGAGYVTAYEQAAGAHIWSTAGTSTAGSSFTFSESMRIDSSGNLLVGKTSNSVSVVGSSLDGAGQSRFSNSSTSSGSTLEVYSTGASAYRFYVSWGGQISATVTSIAGISDASLKQNVRDLETGLTEVMALKPRRFDWVNGDATDVAGFVAQEVETVLPDLVLDYVYNKDEEGNDIIKKSLKMGDILPTLVKAIQEQQALITSLTARIAALEGAQQ